jgi:hypothetical protein
MVQQELSHLSSAALLHFGSSLFIIHLRDDAHKPPNCRISPPPLVPEGEGGVLTQLIPTFNFSFQPNSVILNFI